MDMFDHFKIVVSYMGPIVYFIDGRSVKTSVHKICAGASAGAGKVRVRVRRG